MRWCHAASTSSRRTWLLPVLAIPPWGDAPEECSDGTRPHVGADDGAGEPVPVAYLDGEGERGQSRDPAQARQPLHHWCELAAGGHRGDLLVEAVTASRGQHDGLVCVLERCLGADHVEVLAQQPCVVRDRPRLAARVDDPRRSSNFDRRCRERIRSVRPASRTRNRSRAASSDSVGTRTETTSSRRGSRAKCGASRTSVLTRSPAWRCSFEDAITSQRSPASVNPGTGRTRSGQLRRPSRTARARLGPSRSRPHVLASAAP